MAIKLVLTDTPEGLAVLEVLAEIDAAVQAREAQSDEAA